MKKQKFPIYSMDEFAKNFTEILGIKKGDTINITRSQHEREYELEISWKPETKDDFFALKSLPSEVLKKMGVRVWDKNEETGKTHYLYPGEWFNLIPEGYPVISISNKEEFFYKNKSDDDIRYGCLAYGFTRIESQKQ